MLDSLALITLAVDVCGLLHGHVDAARHDGSRPVTLPRIGNRSASRGDCEQDLGPMTALHNGKSAVLLATEVSLSIF